MVRKHNHLCLTSYSSRGILGTLCFVYVPTHVSEFPINTIIAWIINDYHEQGNIIIITNLLLPLGHIYIMLLHRHTPSSYIYVRIPERSEQEPKT